MSSDAVSSDDAADAGLRSAFPAALATSATWPGDPRWEEARRFHSGIGIPDLVVRPADVAGVQETVRWAGAHGIPVLVRGGGHSAWGTLPRGLVIDLAELRGVRILDDQIAQIGGGETWGEVARVLSASGLGLSSGDTASVGVGGLTLGGGIGWMVRAWGLAADQLVGVQLVTSGGDLIEATDATHPDLMWGLRGGGGNFGVVTRFDFRAQPLPAVSFVELGIRSGHAEIVRTLRDILRDAPRELTVTYMDVPAMDPSAPAGATIGACWAGVDVEALRAVLAPLTAHDGVHVRECAVRSYPEILLEMPPSDPDAPVPGFIGGNTLLDELDDEAIDRLLAFRASSPASVILMRSLGGAYGDVDADATAWPARGATWFAMAGGFDIPGLVDDTERARLEGAWAGIERLGEFAYGNFTTSTDPSFVQRMFPAPMMARLVDLKRTWDPANLFRRTHVPV